MSDRVSRRAYHSPRREAAARETRAAVLDVARVEFAANGYASATLAAIARRAGVSLATVKLVEPTKGRLLVAATEAVVRSEDASRPLVEQGWWTELLDERDPRLLLARLATRVAAALERQVDLLEAAWQAARTEPEIARLEERASLGRRADMRTVIEALVRSGSLRPDLDPDAATDILWATASPQAFALLVRRRGWTPERWASWLADSLMRLLLTAPGPAGSPSDGLSGPKGMVDDRSPEHEEPA